ncbi:MAG TPA: VCBS repeat-containing protein [Phycisphaerae bacterium]|nr:VCBS repeat-containing protein [Phycisphaerae bacterium]HRW52198.1 VCBS repeat-containing protein [Phycisphaerae bacterium]
MRTRFLFSLALLGVGLGSGRLLAQDCNSNGVADDIDVLPLLQKTTISTPGGDLRDIIAVDINNDGNLDLIGISRTLTTIHRLFGYGDGVFGATDPIASPFQSIRTVQAADLDGDGDADLVACDGSRSLIVWFENDGQGQFSAEQIVTVESIDPYSAYLADVDGDGDIDVMDTSRVDGTLAWTENTDGQATWGLRRIILDSLSSPLAVYAADLDGDSDLDVIVGSENDDRTLWCPNLDGAGAFGPAQTISIVADRPQTIVAADIDNDQDLDIILGSKNDNTLAWVENTDGLGTFGPRHIISMTQNNVNSVAAADMDGDGHIDIVACGSAGDELSWYRNTDGAGSFGSGIHITLATPLNPTLALTDYDGNGTPDLFVVEAVGRRLALFRNTPQDCNGNRIPDDCELAGNDCNNNGVPDDCEPAGDCNNNGAPDLCELSATDCNSNGVPDECELAGNDCNNDGVPDDCQQDCNGNGIPEDCEPLVDCNGNGIQDSCDTLVADCDGNGIPDDCDPDCDANGIPDRCDLRPTFAEVYVSSSASNPQAVVAADLDGDGLEDVIIGAATQTKIYWRRNNGDGTFGGKVNITILTRDVVDLKVADIDGDGDPDVLSASATDQKIAWYENRNGATSFGPQRVLGTINRPSTVFAADLDGDSDIDVLAGSTLDSQILWYENLDGLGTFGPKQVITSTASYATCVIAADIDGDGDNDIAHSSLSDGTIAWRENLDGAGDFSGIEHLVSVQSSGAVVVRAADLDGDGDIDLVTGSSVNNRITWFENTDGRGAFGPAIDINSSYAVRTLDAVDLDSDGDIDIAVASFDNSQVYWLENLDGHGGFSSERIITSVPSLPTGIAVSDIDGNGTLDLHVVSSGDNYQRWYRNEVPDCNRNSIPDACELIGNDCDNDGVLDECETDCDENGIPDDCDEFTDCNSNGVPDSCEPDCDQDGIPDACELADNDCDGNGIPDDCQPDCDSDGLPDACEIEGNDCDGNGVPDDCQPDCDGDGVPDICAIVGNDCNGNGIPDDCETDCNSNGIADDCELIGADCNGNGVLDECEPFTDCNANGIADFCDADIGFVATTLIAAAAAPVSPSLADLDNDGDLDLLSANADQREYAWFANLGGDAGFGPAQVIADDINGTRPLVAADLDSDGDLDILAIRTFDDTLEWYENTDGAGTFASARVITTSTDNPVQALADDVDGDGDLDIILAAQHGDRLSWYENRDGHGEFGPRIVIPGSISIPSMIRLADLDGDGDRDLIAASATGNEIFWFRNVVSAVHYSVEQVVDVLIVEPQSIDVADVDGDGDVDLIAAPSLTSQIFWYENQNGAGAFGSRQIVSDTLAGSIVFVSVDLDNDGDPDIVSSSQQMAVLSWHRNDGAGNFAPPVELYTDGLTARRSLAAGDIDDDGDNDIIAAPATSVSDFLLLDNTRDDCNNNHVPDACELSGNDCNENGFPDECDADCNANGIPDDCESFVDCNANGIPDECEPSADCNTNGIQDICDIADGAESDCNNNSVPDACELSGNDCNANGIPDSCESVSDCDGNGVRDICEYSGHDCNANGVFDSCETTVGFFPVPVSDVLGTPDQIRLADIDGDGDLDIISSGGASYIVSWNENLDGAGTFGPLREVTGDLAAAAEDIEAADVDSDGDIDVILCSNNPDYIHWYENTDGLGTFSGPVSIVGAVAQPNSVEVADIDGDGLNDVVVSSSQVGASVAWFRGVGGGGFGPRLTALSSNLAAYLEAADFDGDADIDLVVGSGDAIVLLRNLDGAGSFSSPIVPADSVDIAMTRYAGDLDGDGDLDLYYIGADRQSIGWIQNLDGQGTFGSPQIVTSNADTIYDIAAADFDGDHDLDVVASDYDDNLIIWIENLGPSLGFDVRRILRADAMNARGVCTGDIDRDGDLDFVASWSPINSVVWFENTSNDCDGDGRPDACDLPFEDCNNNGILDSCESLADCDNDGVPDVCELSENDCNGNGLPDDCESPDDCNNSGVPDICELSGNDCNQNAVLDECESTEDCNSNGIPDFCELELNDCNADGVPDDCQADCDGDGLVDDCETQVLFTPSFIDDTFGPVSEWAAADINGDLFPDIVVLHESGVLSWYANLGAGQFAAASVIDNPGGGALALRIADLDGDGDVDLVTTDASDTSLGWYENADGAGVFFPRSLIASGGFGLPGVEIVDLDGDGDLDIAAISSANGVNIAWLPNDGASPLNFGLPQTIDYTISNIADLKPLDVDRDGRMDIVALTISGSDVVWYRNFSGGGQFERPRKIIDDADDIDVIAIADLDSDGYGDLIAVSTANDRTQWLRSVGGAAPFAPSVDIIPELTAINGIQAADINGDGRPDLLVDSRANVSLSWFRNIDGAGAFSTPNFLAQYGKMLVADIDRDGAADLIHTYGATGVIDWLRNVANDCNGNQVPDNCEDTSADCDQNGVPDLCEAAGADCDNDGIPNACELSGNDCNQNGVPDNCESAEDCDNNGLPDICDIAAGEIDCNRNGVPDSCELSENDANGNGVLDSCEIAGGDCNQNGVSDSLETEPQFVPLLVDASASGLLYMELADLNGDTLPDLLTSAGVNPKVRWYPNTGAPIPFVSAFEIATYSLDVHALVVVDIDLDGDNDVVVGYQGPPSDRIVLYENMNGLGDFAGPRVVSYRADGVNSIAAGDVDGDGDTDLIAGLQDRITWYERGASGYSAEKLISMDANTVGVVALADMDLDGDIDVVSAETNGSRLAWHENTDGLGSFDTMHVVATGNAKSDVSLADIDQDGDMDIIVCAKFMPYISWYENLDALGSFGERNVIDDVSGEVDRIDVIDLDRDGDLDVLAVSVDADTITWYENLDGQQNYSPGTLVLTPANDPRDARAADLDGDGDLDIASVSLADNRVIYYPNLANDCNGNGVPDACELDGADCNENGVPDECESPADCDANGIPDICDIANGAADCDRNGVLDRCEILQRDCDSDGVVDICQVLAGLSDDCNVNGIPDGCDLLDNDCNANGLVDACETADGIAMDCNNNHVPDECELSGNDCNGNGIPDECDLIDNDCNGNGIPDECDVLAGDCNANGIPDDCDAETVLVGNIVSTESPHRVRSITSGDFDGDADVDLVVASYALNSIALIENVDGFATPAASIEIDGACLEAVDVVAADINGDGDMDLVAICPGSSAVNWYQNLGMGVFGGANLVTDASGRPLTLATGDVDGDGDLDIACYYSFDRRIDLIFNLDGAGSFGPPLTIGTNILFSNSVCLVDLDGDSDVDVVSFNGSATRRIIWYENLDGMGTFSGKLDLADELPWSVGGLVVADIDSDGHPDLVAGFRNGEFGWFANPLGDANLQPKPTVQMGTAETTLLAAIDVDGDGDPDVLAGDPNEHELVWSENLDGNGAFGPPRLIATLNPGPGLIFGADVTGDGHDEIFVSADLPDDVTWRFKATLRGDIDGDGVVCLEDAGRLVQVLLGQPVMQEDLDRSDQDLNGVVDARDISVFIDALLGN